MKKSFKVKTISFFSILTILVNIASCQSASDNGQPTSIGANRAPINRKISADEFDKKLTTLNNPQLLDVRTPDEYGEGHLKNAINININSADFADKVSKLSRTKPVLVYCLSGGRSAAAAEKMAEMGFSEIYNMDGGIMKWQNEGKQLEISQTETKYRGITMDEFERMLSKNKTVLVDYNAKWCAPCKKMLPVLESLSAKKKDKLTLIKIDADENKELLKLKSISGIPYLELYQDGRLIWKHNGYIDEQQLIKETGL